jgi:DNA-binding SARP family transcriptional activator
MQAAILLGAAPTPWRISAAGELLDDLEQTGDRWTVCLTSLAIGAVYAGVGQPQLAVDVLRRSEQVAADLGAPVLRCWAGLVRTAVAVREGAVGAEHEAATVLHRATVLGLTHAHQVARMLARARPAVEMTQSPDAGGQDAVAQDAEVRDAVALAPPALIAHTRPSSQAVTVGVSLRCLGGFSLATGGVELPWRDLRPRVRALLMLLAMNHGRQLHRERLVDTLWPDAALVSGVRSLQVAVSSIRQCLSAGGVTEEGLFRHGDAYALQLPGVSDQLAEFERLTAAATRVDGVQSLRLRLAALDLYAGDLLPEVGPAEWVVEERARLRLAAAAVSSEAARDALTLGELRTALEVATRSVSLDPYHDSSWQLVVEAYERLGDQSAAAVARREQARVWADLGLVGRGVPHR